MINLLYVLGVWGNGGIEKVITTYCNNLPQEKYKIEIFTLRKETSVFDVELERLGIPIFCPTKNIEGSFWQKNKIRQESFLAAALQKQYDIVHYHNSFGIVYLYLKELKKRNPNCKIVLHSHGDDAEAPYLILKRIYNNIAKRLYKDIPDFNVACSDNAGKWLFSNKIYNSNKYKTIINAFDTKAYCFDWAKRKAIHEELQISSVPVLGTIGRFCYQKNPEYILEILQGLDKVGFDFRFIWIGEGEMKQDIIQKASKAGLDGKIYFITSTDNVQGYLSSMDAFILPSRYEGLVLALIEALCAGLTSYVSEHITRELQLTDKIQYLPITSVDMWVQRILNDVRNGKIVYRKEGEIVKFRRYPESEIAKSKFNLKEMMENVERVYEVLLEQELFNG